MKKLIILSIAAVTLSAGAATAAPGKGYGNRGPGISPYERVAIAQSAARLATIKRIAYRDGRLTRFERVEIRQAERRHAALVARSWRR